MIIDVFTSEIHVFTLLEFAALSSLISDFTVVLEVHVFECS